MRYEWDEVKNQQNWRKHGVSFETATLVFEDDKCLVYLDRVDEKTGEQRWHAVGAIPVEGALRAVLIVVHVYREETNGEQITRVISARKAGKHDVRRYQKQDVD